MSKSDLEDSETDDVYPVKKRRIDQNMAAVSKNNWQSLKSLAECNREMLTKEIAYDVTFLVGKQQEAIKAHKYVLISRSCVFHEMLHTSAYSIPAEITIPDIEPMIFKQMLMFIYTDEITIELDNAFLILDVAKKYCIQSLVKKCMDTMHLNMSAYNICKILENAHINKYVELEKKCMEFIFSNAKQVFVYGDLSKLTEEQMTEIISSDDLVLPEKEIYEGLLKYAFGKCQKHGMEPTAENKKRVLGGLLNHVRFTLMDSTYFTEVVSESGLLPQSDVVKLLKHFLNPQVAVAYNVKKRKNRHILNRFDQHATGWGYKRDKSDALLISSSKTIFIHGVTVYGCCQGAAVYEAMVVIKEGSSNADKAMKKVQLSTDASEKVYEIYLDAPVLMEKDKQYSIILTMKGPASYYGEKGKSEIECEGVRFIFDKSRFSDNITTEQRGQLPGIIFEVLPGTD